MKLVLDNHGGDTKVSKHMMDSCMIWFRIAYKADASDDHEQHHIANDMMSTRFGRIKRRDIIRIALFSIQGGKCNLCGQKYGIGHFHIDHVDALSTSKNNKLQNLQALCGPCNTWKSDRPMHLMQSLRRERGLDVTHPVYFQPMKKAPVSISTADYGLPPREVKKRTGSNKKENKYEEYWRISREILSENQNKPMVLGDFVSHPKFDELKEEVTSNASGKTSPINLFRSTVHCALLRCPFITNEKMQNDRGSVKLHYYLSEWNVNEPDGGRIRVVLN